MRNLKEKVIGGGLARMASQGIVFVVRIGVLMILARLLTPKDFGLVAMVVAFTGVLNLFRDFGLSSAMIQRPVVSPELRSTLFWINLAVGCGLAAILLVASPVIAGFYHEPRLQPVTAVLALGFLFNALGIQHIALLERSMQFTTIAVIELTSLVASSALGVALSLLGYGYWSLVLMTLAAPIVTSAGAWISTGWIPGRPSHQSELGSLVRFGSTATLNGVIVYVAYNLEKVLLGRFWGAEAIGIYGRAYQLASIPTENLNNAIGGVAFSALSRLQDDPERFRAYFLKGYSLVLSLTIPTAVAFALLAEDIIRVVLGRDWAEAAPILRALAPTVAVLALINPLGWLLLSFGLVARSLRVALVLAPLVMAAYIAGLPYGALGVAIGYSTVMCLCVVPHIAWCLHGTVVSLKDALGAACKPIASALLSAAPVLALQFLDGAWTPLARLAVLGTAYFATHFAILIFLMGEKEFYLSVARGLLKPRAST